MKWEQIELRKGDKVKIKDLSRINSIKGVFVNPDMKKLKNNIYTVDEIKESKLYGTIYVMKELQWTWKREMFDEVG